MIRSSRIVYMSDKSELFGFSKNEIVLTICRSNMNNSRSGFCGDMMPNDDMKGIFSDMNITSQIFFLRT